MTNSHFLRSFGGEIYLHLYGAVIFSSLLTFLQKASFNSHFNNSNKNTDEYGSPYREHLWCRVTLLIKTYIDFLLRLMVDFLLCGDTAIAVGSFHISFEGDVEATSLFRHLLRSNDLIITVPPLDCRLGISILNITLKQHPAISLNRNCDLWVCCSWDV